MAGHLGELCPGGSALRTALIAVVGSLSAAALVLSASLGGSMRYFIAPLQFLVVFKLLLASAVAMR